MVNAEDFNDDPYFCDTFFLGNSKVIKKKRNERISCFFFSRTNWISIKHIGGHSFFYLTLN